MHNQEVTMIRKARAVWHGTGRDEKGDLTAESGVLSQNDIMTILLLVAGVCWIAAFRLFEIVCGPMFLTRRHAS
jgi:hypothetical protein